MYWVNLCFEWRRLDFRQFRWWGRRIFPSWTTNWWSRYSWLWYMYSLCNLGWFRYWRLFLVSYLLILSRLLVCILFLLFEWRLMDFIPIWMNSYILFFMLIWMLNFRYNRYFILLRFLKRLFFRRLLLNLYSCWILKIFLPQHLNPFFSIIIFTNNYICLT